MPGAPWLPRPSSSGWPIPFSAPSTLRPPRASRPAPGAAGSAVANGAEVPAVRERLPGPDPPATLTARANLAASYRSVGRPAEAISIGEKVRADRERTLGPDHPATL